MATEISIPSRKALKQELLKHASDDEVWRDKHGTYFVGNDVENNENYEGCVYQGTVQEVIGQLDN